MQAALNEANGRYLTENKAPSRKVNELDNRGSHYYLALYWAEALATQEQDAELGGRFRGIADELAANEEQIIGELTAAQGSAVDIGGYYHPNDEQSICSDAAEFNAESNYRFDLALAIDARDARYSR